MTAAIAEGVWVVDLPLPHGGTVDATNCYLLADDAGGVHLLDPGWDTPDNRARLEAGLAEAKEVAEIIAVEKSLLAAEWDAITSLVPRERLAVWTPNTEEELADWLDRGLRDVTTDRPDLALAVRSGVPADAPR